MMVDLYARSHVTEEERLNSLVQYWKSESDNLRNAFDAMRKVAEESERTIQRQASECIDLHAQNAVLTESVQYWRNRALHCTEIEAEGT